MKKSVSPSDIAGTVAAPASKSLTQRALAAALLSGIPVTITNPSSGDDAVAAFEIIRALGARVERREKTILVHSGREAGESDLDCRESGLSLRMFTPIAALFDREIRLSGRSALLRRPLGPIEAPLSELGVRCRTRDGFAPVTVQGPMRGGRARVDASIGSQFLTGLLMALPKAARDSEITVEKLTSLPYIDMTLLLLKAFGIAVEHDRYRTFRVAGGQAYRCSEYQVEGDWSGAAFLAVAGAIAGSVRIEGLDLDSPQGDKRILEALREAGAEVVVTPRSVTVSRSSLRAFEFEVTDCPDLAPPLVALAAFADGVSTLYGTSRLRLKESDRAETLRREFGRIGLEILTESDRMSIRGGTVRGGEAFAHGDHRIAMALAVAGLAADSAVAIEGAECVAKSYPGFFDDLSGLGGRIDE